MSLKILEDQALAELETMARKDSLTIFTNESGTQEKIDSLCDTIILLVSAIRVLKNENEKVHKNFRSYMEADRMMMNSEDTNEQY